MSSTLGSLQSHKFVQFDARNTEMPADGGIMNIACALLCI